MRETRILTLGFMNVCNPILWKQFWFTKWIEYRLLPWGRSWITICGLWFLCPIPHFSSSPQSYPSTKPSSSSKKKILYKKWKTQFNSISEWFSSIQERLIYWSILCEKFSNCVPRCALLGWDRPSCCCCYCLIEELIWKSQPRIDSHPRKRFDYHQKTISIWLFNSSSYHTKEVKNNSFKKGCLAIMRSVHYLVMWKIEYE